MKKKLEVVDFSTALNAILLMVMFSFILYLIDSTTFSTPALSLLGSLSGANAGTTGVLSSLNSNLGIVFAVLGIGSIAAGVLTAFSIGFPNPYVIFAPFAYFTLGFLTFPVSLFDANSGLPLEIRVMLIFILNLIMLFGVFDLARQR